MIAKLDQLCRSNLVSNSQSVGVNVVEFVQMDIGEQAMKDVGLRFETVNGPFLSHSLGRSDGVDSNVGAAVYVYHPALKKLLIEPGNEGLVEIKVVDDTCITFRGAQYDGQIPL
jgi:hypothetical protein